MNAFSLLALLGSLGVGVAPASPLDVGTAKQVFIDGRFIESKEGVSLVVNRPRGERRSYSSQSSSLICAFKTNSGWWPKYSSSQTNPAVSPGNR